MSVSYTHLRIFPVLLYVAIVSCRTTRLQVGADIRESVSYTHLGYLEYAADIFEADPFYFLAKPIKEKKLTDAIDRALEKIKEEDRSCLLLQSRGEIVKIKIDDIWYVESSRRNLTIYEAGESSRVLMKLSDMEKLLPEYFLRCHQSYLVNMDRIRKFTLDGIVLIDGRVIPVSRARYTETKDKFLKNLGERLI